MMNLKKLLNLEEKNRKSLLNFASQALPVLAFFVLAVCVFYIGCSFSWSVFSERDISRASDWLNGQFYWPGPEMSGGNNLPGPFFYFLLFPAFLMGDDIYSQAALWTTIWFALTYTVAFSFISKIISHKESLLIFLIVFILNINIHSDHLNPEFAVMFHVLALIGLYYWRERKNSFYLYLTGLVIALGIQIHLLVALHIITVLLFYIIDKSERKKIKALLLFLLLALSPVLIYSVLKYFHVFETPRSYYDTHINNVLKDIFSEKWFRNIKQTFIPFIILFSFCFSLNLAQNKKRSIKTFTQNLFIIILVPFSIAFFIARTPWYILFIPVFSIILISKWLDNLMPDKADKRILFLVGIVLFAINLLLIKWISFREPKSILYIFFLAFLITVIINLQWHKEILHKSALLGLCLFVSAQIGTLKVFPRNQRTVKQQTFSLTWPTYKKLYPLMKRIYLETGWLPKTAMKKILNIGLEPERSLLTDYSMTVKKLNKPGGGGGGWGGGGVVVVVGGGGGGVGGGGWGGWWG
ncbi:MAG: glycosyltransferase family 39 protein, partial [Oligoflexia bacterium]|nr:glycosyltransferase family 39 protein [Oligoflexia bacterium]